MIYMIIEKENISKSINKKCTNFQLKEINQTDFGRLTL